MSNLQLTIDLEEDGRFLVEVPELPGVLAYGATRESAIANAEILALRVLADRLEAGEKLPILESVFALPKSRNLAGEVDETEYLLSSDAMKQRLLEAKSRDFGLILEEVSARLGI